MRVAILVGAVSAALAMPAFAAGPSADENAQAREIYQTIVEMETSVEGGKVPEMAAYLAKRFRDGGFAGDDVHLVPFDKTAALIVRYRGDGSGLKPVLLIAHMDVVPAHREELATLVPAKAGSRTLSAEHKIQSPRVAHTRDASLPLDEDQFDIPTFLRRQGHTEMP